MSDVKKGRKVKVDPVTVARWRQARKASIVETAKRFGISEKTVSNYCRDFGEEAERQRSEWRAKKEIEEAEGLARAEWVVDSNLRWLHEANAEFERDPSITNLFSVIDVANRLVPREFRNKKPGEW